MCGAPALHAREGAAQCAAAAASSRVSGDARLPALLAEARRQHELFGGQEIDTDGRLVRAGHGEAEFDRNAGETEPTWRRVERFWLALQSAGDLQVRDSEGRSHRVDLLRQAVGGTSNARLNSFGGGERDLGLGARETDTVLTSLLRASLVDTPWSAAFISFVVRSAGFTEDEFRFSQAHADYARQAFADPGAWRACDAAVTAPRPGDLLCNTRARAAAIDTFESLGEALGSGASLPMHCDLVVSVDPAGLQAQSIGGNVLQSVTLRRLQLQPQADATQPPLLSPRYAANAGSPESSFNDQPWVLLMQLR
jgi:hypothetical protein